MAEAQPRRPNGRRVRSHAAIPVALALVLVGAVLGGYSFLVPLALGLILVVSALSLLSSRINPLSPHFYSERKASWSSVAVVFLGGVALLGDAYWLWKAAVGGLLPHV